MAVPAQHVAKSLQTAARGSSQGFALRDFGFGLSGYFMFGAGYIGYMTFIVALLRQQGMSGAQITGFYTALGLAVLASSRIWARMLDYFKGGESLAILNLVLAVVTVLPAFTSAASTMLKKSSMSDALTFSPPLPD